MATHNILHNYTRLMALFPGLPRWASTRKVKPIWFYWSKWQWVAVASAGPYASLHLALDWDNHASTPSLRFLQAGCPSCFSKIQISFTFQVLAHQGNPRQRAVKRLCACVCVEILEHASSKREDVTAVWLVITHKCRTAAGENYQLVWHISTVSISWVIAGVADHG